MKKHRGLKSILLLGISLLIIFIFVMYDVNKDKKEITSKIYQAENAQLVGVDKGNKISGYSGTGYVTNFKEKQDAVVFNVRVPAKGIYGLEIGYQIPKSSNGKYTKVLINHQFSFEAALPQLGKFTKTPPSNVLLKKGVNRITLQSDWGYYNIDDIKIIPAPASVPAQISRTPVDPNASKEAKTLMRYLADNDGRHILSGQQSLADAEWLSSQIGKKPAIVGFDLKDYSPTIAGQGVQSDQIEQAIEWAGQGGIVALSWHWSAPKGIINDPMGGFYTKNTTFNIKYALEHKKSEDYQLLLRDIDVIAEQLKRLQLRHIPVLFRPLHEAEGGWFWWGAQGPGPAKALYRLLYRRLTIDHHINNLIWVWSSPSKKWYPGNRYVDIIGYDSYPAAGNFSPISDQYNLENGTVGRRKMAALSETGPIPDPAMLKTFHVYWSWFLTWQGDFLRDGRFNSIRHLRQVYENPYVITLDRLPKTLQQPHSGDKH